MTQHPGFDKYVRSINRLHEDVKERVKELRKSLARRNEDDKQARAKNAHVALGNLSQLLHEQDLPNWLNPLVQHIGQFMAATPPGEERDNHADHLAEFIFSQKDNIYGPPLIDSSSQGAFDIEAAYNEEYQSSTSLPDLFDKLIVRLF